MNLRVILARGPYSSPYGSNVSTSQGLQMPPSAQPGLNSGVSCTKVPMCRGGGLEKMRMDFCAEEGPAEVEGVKCALGRRTLRAG